MNNASYIHHIRLIFKLTIKFKGFLSLSSCGDDFATWFVHLEEESLSFLYIVKFR